MNLRTRLAIAGGLGGAAALSCSCRWSCIRPWKPNLRGARSTARWWHGGRARHRRWRSRSEGEVQPRPHGGGAFPAVPLANRRTQRKSCRDPVRAGPSAQFVGPDRPRRAVANGTARRTSGNAVYDTIAYRVYTAPSRTEKGPLVHGHPECPIRHPPCASSPGCSSLHGRGRTAWRALASLAAGRVLRSDRCGSPRPSNGSVAPATSRPIPATARTNRAPGSEFAAMTGRPGRLRGRAAAPGADASHELRTPLTSLTVQPELLAGPADSSPRSWRPTPSARRRRLTALVNDLVPTWPATASPRSIPRRCGWTSSRARHRAARPVARPTSTFDLSCSPRWCTVIPMRWSGPWRTSSTMP
jgi:two-component system sensor histidine kinase MprB